MGCDIHMFCEEKIEIDGVKKWVNRDHLKLNPYYGEGDYEFKYYVVELCGERNYSMFTALCGVRDYSDRSPRISDPRGIPDDSCDLIKDYSILLGEDGHSHSYVTLKDVIDFVKENKPVVRSGMISSEQAKKLDEKGEMPESWCQWTSMSGYVHRTWEDSTKNPLSKLLERMCERFKPYLEMDMISDEMAEEFRVVFMFDN
jgi:hypothetical protein